MPQDLSHQLSVQFTQVDAAPLVGDTVTIAAEVLHGGAMVPNAQLTFGFSKPTAVQVLASGPTWVRALVLSAGPQTVTATANGYGAAPSATTQLGVEPAVSIDSVRPRATAFGDTVLLYGNGLAPAGLVGVFAGGRSLPLGGFVPADSTRPGRAGRLAVWMAAGMPLSGVLRVLTAGGAASGADTVTVSPDDVLEPNDTAPAMLPIPFTDPALAMEGRDRNDARPAIDWYRAQTAAGQNLTVQWVVPREKLNYGAVVSDTVVTLNDTPLWQLRIGTDFVGSQCLGQEWDVPDVSDTVSMTFRRPAQQYEVALSYHPTPAPAQYGLSLIPSLVTAIAPDAFESNDACTDATPLPTDSTTLNLTIDRPYDFDWYKFSVGGNGDSIQFAMFFPPVNDLDIGIFQSFLPDSVTYLGCLCSGAPDQEVGYTLLPAGDYLAIVSSYQTLPTAYTLAARAVPTSVSSPFIGSQAPPAAVRASVRAVGRRGMVHAWARVRR